MWYFGKESVHRITIFLQPTKLWVMVCVGLFVCPSSFPRHSFSPEGILLFIIFFIWFERYV